MMCLDSPSLLAQYGAELVQLLETELRSALCDEASVQWAIYPEVNRLLLAAREQPWILVRPGTLERSDGDDDRCGRGWLVGLEVHYLREVPKYVPQAGEEGQQGALIWEYGDLSVLNSCLAAVEQLAELLGRCDLTDAPVASVEVSELYDEALLRQHALFLGTLSVKYRVLLSPSSGGEAC